MPRVPRVALPPTVRYPLDPMNDESHLLLPDDLDLTNVEDVVSALAPELRPARWYWTEIYIGSLFILTGLALGTLGFFQSPLMSLSGLVPMILAWFVWAKGADRVRRYHKELRETPGVLFEQIAQKFTREIRLHRDRVLGPNSDWERARAPLVGAKDEANRSAAYWRGRQEEDHTNETARSQLRSAESLEAKFAEALGELDHRSEALLQFFNECEAKLPVLRRFKRDHEESLALAKLQERADETVVDAQSALGLIGQQFVSEALRMGQALGALERYELKESAGTVPLDRIERVADQILSSSHKERETLAALMEKMAG